MTNSRVRNALLNLLTDRVVSEDAIRNEQERGSLRHYGLEVIQDELNQLLIENKIRWVAFRGYTRGGRPS